MIQFPVPEAPNPGLLPDSIVWTPEIDRLNDFIIESLRMQCRGCAVFGQQCNGKSYATRFLMTLLPTTLGHTTAVVRWSIRAQSAGSLRTERTFIQERLIQSGCPAVTHRDLAVLWRRLLSHLAELAQSAGSRWIVIMIDEAQNLSLDEYNRLIHCFNGLEDLNVKPFFLLVGQPELANTSASWTEFNGMQVIGRFFSRRNWFRGISMEDVGFVLEAFDERDAAGLRWSARLFPQLLGIEWSMTQWHEQFIEALQALMVEHSIQTTLRLPMQMLRSTVLLLLDRALQGKADPRQVSAAAVLQALRDTGFTSSLSYYLCDGSDGSARKAA